MMDFLKTLFKNLERVFQIEFEITVSISIVSIETHFHTIVSSPKKIKINEVFF